MNWDQIQGGWKEFKGKAQAKWGDLTDDEYHQVAGNREEFEGMLQRKYGNSKEAVRREVDDWLSGL